MLCHVQIVAVEQTPDAIKVFYAVMPRQLAACKSTAHSRPRTCDAGTVACASLGSPRATSPVASLQADAQSSHASSPTGTTSSHVITTNAPALSPRLDALVVRRGGLLTPSALVSGLDATMQQCANYVPARCTRGASAAGAGFASGAATARAADQHTDTIPISAENSIRPLRKSVSFADDDVPLLPRAAKHQPVNKSSQANPAHQNASFAEVAGASSSEGWQQVRASPTKAKGQQRRSLLQSAGQSAPLSPHQGSAAQAAPGMPGATSTASHKMRRSTPVREQTFAYKAGAAFASKSISMDVKVAVVKKTLAHLSPRALRHWRAAMASVDGLQTWTVGSAMPQGQAKHLAQFLSGLTNSQVTVPTAQSLVASVRRTGQ